MLGFFKPLKDNLRDASPKSLFLWTFAELHDYFKDHDVRIAHVLGYQ